MTSRERSARSGFVLDWMFLIGVFFKALDGVLEVIGGIPLLFATGSQITGLARWLTAGELAEDPGDFVANLIMKTAGHLDSNTLLLVGVYLIVHGIVKIGIVVALIRDTRRAYPWAIGALTLLLVIQLVDLVIKPSIGVVLLTLIDALIIWLTLREWRLHRSLKQVIALRVRRTSR